MAEDVTLIIGVTSLGDDVFVLREQSRYVDLYDSDTLRRVRKVFITDLMEVADMTSSTRHQCVYISDYKGKVIFRLTADFKLSRWTVSDGPFGLSVMSNDNLLVTCPDTRRLKEFTSDGRLVREIIIDYNISSNIWHAVELSSGQFAVSHGGYKDDNHQVCVVNSLGQVGSCYGKQKGARMGQLENPVHLSVVEGSVLVACMSSPRIIQLSRTMSYVGTILTGQDGLKGPYAMHYDSEMRQLYVADNTETNSLIAGNVKLFQIAIEPTNAPLGPVI